MERVEKLDLPETEEGRGGRVGEWGMVEKRPKQCMPRVKKKLWYARISCSIFFFSHCSFNVFEHTKLR
jgi:hypothetical protein